jgi:transcriptional regulator with XRE-family HTH domain
MPSPPPPSSETGPFPERLRALRADWTRRHGRRLTRERLAAALTVAPCTIMRWESGSQQPYDCHIEALCEFFGVSRHGLGLTLSPPPPPETPRDAAGSALAASPSSGSAVVDPPEVAGGARGGSDRHDAGDACLGVDVEQQGIAAVARQSSGHAVRAGSATLMTTVLEQLRTDVQRVARVYPQTSPPSLLGEMVRVRDLAYLLLERTCRPAQLKDTYLIAGQVCGLLALTSLDLGCADAAADHARAAWTYAEIIEHDGLRAWARGTQAVVAFWSGHPGVAVDLATSGQAYARSGAALVRLRSLEARAWALVGDASETTRAIGAARRALDDGRTDELHTLSGGEFTFSPVRQAFCAVASYVQIGDAEQAAREAETGIALYGADPVEGRWYRAEYGARIDLATARLMRRELDGAEEALTTVFLLPPDRRTARITRRLHQLSERLAEQPYGSASTARRLRERIEHFSATGIICAPPG